MDLKMTSRPGYTGQLNAKISERVTFLSELLGLSQLRDKFPHLDVQDGSWRVNRSSTADFIDYAGYIDHTLLKAEATAAQVAQLCEEAKTHHFKAICVNTSRVPLAVKLLKGTGVGVGCTVGFPLGATTTTTKVHEAAEAVATGATDIDFVVSIGDVKDGNFRDIYEELQKLVAVCPAPAITTKIILEVCLLSESEIIDVCILSVAAGVTYVKTSTGFNAGGGATPESIDTMLAVVGNSALVKASGGVRDRATAQQYILAGVSRIGTSSGIDIVSSS